jgi:hypothetical protein
MREFRILKREQGFYVYQFWKQGRMEWAVTSYILLTNLRQVASDWLDNEIHPDYKHT